MPRRRSGSPRMPAGFPGSADRGSGIRMRVRRTPPWRSSICRGQHGLMPSANTLARDRSFAAASCDCGSAPGSSRPPGSARHARSRLVLPPCIGERSGFRRCDGGRAAAAGRDGGRRRPDRDRAAHAGKTARGHGRPAREWRGGSRTCARVAGGESGVGTELTRPPRPARRHGSPGDCWQQRFERRARDPGVGGT